MIDQLQKEQKEWRQHLSEARQKNCELEKKLKKFQIDQATARSRIRSQQNKEVDRMKREHQKEKEEVREENEIRSNLDRQLVQASKDMHEYDVSFKKRNPDYKPKKTD